MVEKFNPKVNEPYFIKQHTLFHILEGVGRIQVDFKNYGDWDDKLIFLEKGQYIKFLSDSFTVRKIVFTDEKTFNNSNIRVLFKHLVSLGYISYQDCAECQKYLSSTLFSDPKDIIDVSINQWFWQNPFNAQKNEYQIIFDLKEIVDEEFLNKISVEDLLKSFNNQKRSVHLLVKNKVGLTVKNLLTNKRLLETQKEVAFTNKSR